MDDNYIVRFVYKENQNWNYVPTPKVSTIKFSVAKINKFNWDQSYLGSCERLMNSKIQNNKESFCRFSARLELLPYRSKAHCGRRFASPTRCTSVGLPVGLPKLCILCRLDKSQMIAPSSYFRIDELNWQRESTGNIQFSGFEPGPC